MKRANGNLWRRGADAAPRPAWSACHETRVVVMRLPLVEAFSGDDWGGKPWLMMIFAAASGRELAAWKARLRAGQVEFWEEDHGAQRSIYFADPNGMVLEVTTPTSESAIPPNQDARDTVLRWVEAQARGRPVR